MNQIFWKAPIVLSKSLIEEFQKIFKTTSLGIVDTNGVTVIDYGRQYFFKAGDTLFPVLNNRTWAGDYYDEFENLICTRDNKIWLMRVVKSNILMLDKLDNGDDAIVSEITTIISIIASDYWRTIRGYSKQYDFHLAFGELRDNMAERYKNSNEEIRLEFRVFLINLIDRAVPHLTDMLTEMSCVHNLAYQVLTFPVSHGEISVVSVGDHRINEWERLSRRGLLKQYEEVSYEPLEHDEPEDDPNRNILKEFEERIRRANRIDVVPENKKAFRPMFTSFMPPMINGVLQKPGKNEYLPPVQDLD